MTAEQAKALRPYFHGLTDEQFTEIISEWPLSNISSAMDDYALHIAEQAVGEKRDARANRILSRIKQLTSE